MEPLESTSQSFIVKVWVEDTTEKGGHGVWHGHITHVSSSRRRYLKNLNEIGDFIAPYLEAMDVKLAMRWRRRRWLRSLRGRC